MDICLMRNYGNSIPRENLRFEHAVLLLHSHKDDLFLSVMDKYLRNSGHVTVLLKCKVGRNGTFYQNNLHAQYFSTRLRENIQIIPNPRAYIERHFTAMYRPSIVITDDLDSEVYLQKYCPQYYNYASNHFCQLNISGCIEGLNLAHPIDLSKFDHQLSLFNCNHLREKVCIQSIIQILPPCFIFFTAFGDYKEKLHYLEVINSFNLFKYQYDKYFGHEILLVLGGDYFQIGSAESKYRDHLRSSLETLRKDHNVIFLKKPLNQSEKKTLLRLSYAAIYLDENPDFEEIKFAMSLGTPIISSNVGYGANMIDHGVSGFTVEPKRIDIIASCMESLSTPTVYHRFSMAARKAYLKSYSETSLFLQTVSVKEIPDFKIPEITTYAAGVHDSVVNSDFIQSVNNLNIENDWFVKNQYSADNKHQPVLDLDTVQTDYEKELERKIAIKKQFYVNPMTELYPEFRFEYVTLPRWSEEDEVIDQMYGDHLFEIESINQVEKNNSALSDQPSHLTNGNLYQEPGHQMYQAYLPPPAEPYQSTSKEQYQRPPFETYQPSSARLYPCSSFESYQLPPAETYKPPSSELYETSSTEDSELIPSGIYKYPLKETNQLTPIKPFNFTPHRPMQLLGSMQPQLSQPIHKSYQLPLVEPYITTRDQITEPPMAQTYSNETIQPLEPTQLQLNPAMFKPYQLPVIEPFASLRGQPVDPQMAQLYPKETIQSLESIPAHLTQEMQQHQPVREFKNQSLQQFLNQPMQQLQNQPIQQLQNQPMKPVLNLEHLQKRPMQQLQIQTMPQLQHLSIQQLQKLTMQQLQNLSIQQLQNPTIPPLEPLQQHPNDAVQLQQREVLMQQQKEAMQMQQKEVMQMQQNEATQPQQKEAMQSYQPMQLQPNQTLQTYQSMQPNLNKAVVPSYQPILPGQHFPVQPLQVLPNQQPVRPYYVGMIKQYTPQVVPAIPIQNYPRPQLVVPNQPFWFHVTPSGPSQSSESQFNGSEYATPREYFEPDEEQNGENEAPDDNDPTRRWQEVFANDSMDECSVHGSELSETHEDAWSGICSDDTPSTGNRSWRVFNHSYHSNSQYSDNDWEEANQDSGDEVRKEENGLEISDHEINGSLNGEKNTEVVEQSNGCKECREEQCVQELHTKVDTKLENNQGVNTAFHMPSKSARRKAKKRRMKKEHSELV